MNFAAHESFSEAAERISKRPCSAGREGADAALLLVPGGRYGTRLGFCLLEVIM